MHNGTQEVQKDGHKQTERSDEQTVVLVKGDQGQKLVDVHYR